MSGPTCKYCKKQFSKESVLAAHLCEPKRRWQQENETGVRLGFNSYVRFYELTQGSAKNKDYASFVESPYYSAFVKFGQYMVQIRCVNTKAFTEWVLKHNKKLDQWTKEEFYTLFLLEYLRKEDPLDAIKRSLLNMQEAVGGDMSGFFGTNANKLCSMIVNGRISPWVVYNCKTGVAFLESLNEEQVTMVFYYIDPEFWGLKFKDYVADAEFAKAALGEAGL